MHASPGGRQARGEHVSEMWEFPGRPYGVSEGHPLSGRCLSGDQQPWAECEEPEVQCRSPGEKGDGHPSLGEQRATPIPGLRAPPHLAVLGLGLTLETLAQFFPDILGGACSTAVVERTGDGTTLMPKEMDGILGPSPHDRISCSYCPSVIRA